MRSFCKLPSAVLFAAVALFAVVATSSTAHAFTVRDIDPAAAPLSGPETIEQVAISWWQARRARSHVRRDLFSDCRGTRNRGVCYRESVNAYREMRDTARQTYRECRQNGGTRFGCRQSVRDYWVREAYGEPAGGGTDSGGGDTLPDELPPDQIPQ